MNTLIPLREKREPFRAIPSNVPPLPGPGLLSFTLKEQGVSSCAFSLGFQEGVCEALWEWAHGSGSTYHMCAWEVVTG